MIEEIFILRLCESVKNSNLSREEIARRAEITPQKLNKMLRGKLLPRANALVTLSIALNVSTDYLIGRTDNPKGIQKHPPSV